MAGVTTPEGIVIPAAGDQFDYLGEQRRMAASTRSIVPVPDRATADSVVAAMNTDGRPVSDTNPVYVHNLANKGLEFKNGEGVWRPAGPALIMGHAGRTASFQNGFNTSTQTAVQLNAAQILRGGMTFDAANYCLVVPVSGLYRVTAQGMFTGASGNLNIVVAWKNNSSTTNIGAPASGPKPDGNDVRYFAQAVVPLLAGDKVGIVQQSAASAWGTTGYDGSFVEVEYVGP